MDTSPADLSESSHPREGISVNTHDDTERRPSGDSLQSLSRASTRPRKTSGDDVRLQSAVGVNPADIPFPSSRSSIVSQTTDLSACRDSESIGEAATTEDAQSVNTNTTRSFRRTRFQNPLPRNPHPPPPSPINPDPLPPSVFLHRNLHLALPGGSCYMDAIAELSDWLPHLKTNVLAPHCRAPDSGSVMVFDQYQGQYELRPAGEINATTFTNSSSRHIGNMLRTTSVGVETRLLLVEDLTPHMMEGLGSNFALDPDFFAEHLHGSGFAHPKGSESDPITWLSHGGASEYLSFRWLRPVRRERHEGISWSHWRQAIEAGSTMWYSNVMGNNLRGKRIEKHFLRSLTNILRKGLFLGTEPEPSDLEENKVFAAAWEERVTLCRISTEGWHTVIILLDPLPCFQHIEATDVQGEDGRFGEDRRTNESVWAFYNICPRRPSFRVTELLSQPLTSHDRIALNEHFYHVSTTRSDLTSWLERQAGHLDPFEGLLHVIHCDIVALHRRLTLGLREITVESIDEYLLQEQLVHWRAFINTYQLELPLMREGVEQLARFCYGNHVPPAAHHVISEIASTLSRLISQVERAHIALRAEISIMESKRGIAEAESVSKLTELAFIFIPLPFASSVFSMQINELKNAVPLWSFIIAALIVVGISYSIRLIIRSRFVIDNKRELFARVRADAEITSTRIPTRVFLR